MTPDTLRDAALFEYFTPFFAVLQQQGFERVQGPTMRWRRTRTGPEATQAIDEVVVWRHPRYPNAVHGHVSTSRSPHAVHLRFFDPSWTPDEVLPGHLGKGFEFNDDADLRAMSEHFCNDILSRALAWFVEPIEAGELLNKA